MYKLLFILFVVFLANTTAAGQTGEVVVLSPYKRPTSEGETPVSYSTITKASEEYRRKVALAKVGAKSVSPIMTRNQGVSPVQINKPRSEGITSAKYAPANNPKVDGETPRGEAPTTRPLEYTTSGITPILYQSDTPSNGETPVSYSAVSEEYPVDEPVTTVTVNGLEVRRQVRRGRGQVGSELFTPVTELYYVQFAVYCKDTPVDKAPPIEDLYLLWHSGSTCPGGVQGASYIVKGYGSPDEARAAVRIFKSKHIDCWYNPALTGAAVEIIGVR